VTNRSFYSRYAWPIMIALGLLLPAIVWGAREAFEHSNNNIHQWLPQHFRETQQYEEFRRRFGTDEFAVASWSGCTLQDQRLEEFARRCEQSKWFASVTTGPRLLGTLTDEPFNLSREEGLARLEGTLVGPDHRTTCALVTLSKAGDLKRTVALAALREIAVTQCHIDPDQLRLGGDAVINAAVDIESQRAISEWIILSWVISLAVAWSCLRDARLMVMIFVVAGYSSALATAAIYYTGGTMNLVLVVVPVLIYVLPLSAAVHLSNYYRDAVRQSGPDGAAVRAVAAGWTPCMLSAVTTALGLISLSASKILPVRMFGVYAAGGILVSLAVLFGLLPAALETWPLHRGSPPADSGAASHNLPQRLIRRWVQGLIRRRRLIVGICLGGLGVFGGGVALVDTNIAPAHFFSPRSRWVRDSLWLQEKLGPMVPIEVVLHFHKPADKPYPMTFLGRMELVGAVERALQGFQRVGGTISAATFAPPLDVHPQSPPDHSDHARHAAGTAPDGGIGSVGRAMLRAMGLGDREALRRRILNQRLLDHRQRFAETHYLHVGPQDEWWRISARVRAFSHMDHDKFVYGEVEQRVDELLRQQTGSSGSVQAVCTGVVPLVYLSQRELLSGLYKSFCLAFVMIGVVMLLLLRNFWAAVLVMLPNVLPVVVTFGTMGWTARLVDVGAMMTASVALGIAVDDTLHYLTWFGRALRQGQTRPQAIVEAYLRCAPAMAQTTLIAGLGLLVFALSSFQPVSQFGLLMFILLAAALVGDLVLLPAMLATRWGKYFEPTRRAGGGRG
jgi:predicted RND superfamily exporter protein